MVYRVGYKHGDVLIHRELFYPLMQKKCMVLMRTLEFYPIYI